MLGPTGPGMSMQQAEPVRALISIRARGPSLRINGPGPSNLARADLWSRAYDGEMDVWSVVEGRKAHC